MKRIGAKTYMIKQHKRLSGSNSEKIPIKKSITKSITKKKLISFIIAIILIIVTINIIKYLSFYLPADEAATAAMASTEEITVEEAGNTIIFTPTNREPSIGYIYYPGGQVEPESFAYAASEIAKSGVKVIIQRMPFNLAIFGKNRAFSIIDSYDNIDKWYIGGFSLGGVVACMAAADHPDIFDGIVLYASYTTKSNSLVDSEIKTLSLSGGNDGLATPTKIEDTKKYLPADTKYVQIPGGNHTQMAIYGEGNLQSGDNVASLSRMEQQKIIIDETVEFLNQ
jgi:dienelactone hydrolase